MSNQEKKEPSYAERAFSCWAMKTIPHQIDTEGLQRLCEELNIPSDSNLAQILTAAKIADGGASSG